MIWIWLCGLCGRPLLPEEATEMGRGIGRGLGCGTRTYSSSKDLWWARGWIGGRGFEEEYLKELDNFDKRKKKMRRPIEAEMIIMINVSPLLIEAILMTPPSSLANRLLFQSSSPFDSDLSNEIYDLISLSLRTYISPWYSKISRYDKDFLPQLTSTLSTVILQLHQRISSDDIPSLLLIDLPVIMTEHYRDYRSAKVKVGTAYGNGGGLSVDKLFAGMQPHIALTEEGIRVEYYRQTVDNILRLILPPEDYASDVERSILTEVILKMFLDDIFPRISHPAFIYHLLLNIVGHSDEEDVKSSSSSLIVTGLSALQTFSALCLSFIDHYKHFKHLNRPHIDYSLPLILFFSEILSANSSFFPSLLLISLSLLISLLTIPLPFFPSPPISPLLLPHIILSSLSSPPFLLSTTRSLKHSLFPNGYPGPTPPHPTPEQVSLLKSNLINSICKSKLPRFLLGPHSRSIVQHALDPLSNQQCNLHLVVVLLDRVLAVLFPELVAQS